MQPKLQSQIKVSPLDIEIDHKSKLLFLGSCFAENIGKKLLDLKFDCAVNPLGISYNPISLFNLLERSLQAERFIKEELDFANERYFSYDLHSIFSHTIADDLLAEANKQLEIQSERLLKADYLLLSLGTAWVHILKKDDRLVNNCHKIASTEFNKAILSVNDIVDAWKQFDAELKKQNQNKKVVFTVSPIRHLKDGFRENQLSKSTLHLAIEEICKEFDYCYYFPSYEIMMDELRDYRFYERDLVHPNQLAIDIIWEHFQSSCLSKEILKPIEQLQKLQTSIAHRPFDSGTRAHLEFLKKLLSDLQKFEADHKVGLEVERMEIKKRIDQHPIA